MANDHTQVTEFDHLAHAKEQGQYTGRWADSPDERSIPSVLGVLAHATIALAEEQRTTNLIAVVTGVLPNGAGAFPPPATWAAQAEILRRLGLTTPPGERGAQ